MHFLPTHKSAEEVTQAFQSFIGTDNPHIKRVYTDGSKEFEKSLKDLKFPHDVSLPYDPQSNGVAENGIRRLKEGVRCTFVQSGLSLEWWAEAAKCFTAYKNCTDTMAGTGQTPYERRFNYSYKGPQIPFGAAVRYLPSGPMAERQHTFSSNMRLGIFMRPEFNSDNVYKGNSILIDAESLAEAVRPNEVQLIRVKTKEIVSLFLDITSRIIFRISSFILFRVHLFQWILSFK